VAVLARDAETKKPIAGAEVQISYALASASDTMGCITRRTGVDGIARLQPALDEHASALVEGTAVGYLVGEASLSAEAVRAIEPAGLFEAVDQRPVTLILEMYAEPRPTVELVVPTGYRGLVKVEVQVQEDAGLAPGQRDFRWTVPASGVLQVSGPPQLRHLLPADFRASFADGAPLNHHPKDPAPGFWWVKREGAFQCFLIGTQAEFDACRRASQLEDFGTGRSAGGAKGQGRGRRGRRSNPAPSESGSADPSS
jgi:hypothetical protein